MFRTHNRHNKKSRTIPAHTYEEAQKGKKKSSVLSQLSGWLRPLDMGWVAGLGGGLRIVSPEPVVQKMQALVQRLAEQYCAPDGDKTSV